MNLLRQIEGEIGKRKTTPFDHAGRGRASVASFALMKTIATVISCIAV